MSADSLTCTTGQHATVERWGSTMSKTRQKDAAQHKLIQGSTTTTHQLNYTTVKHYLDIISPTLV
jgi:hypothetical protein